MSCLAVPVQIRAKDRPWGVAACIAYLQNSFFHPYFATFWCAKRLRTSADQTTARWQDRWDRFRVCYQSELIMGSVSEHEYRLQNHNTGDEVSPSCTIQEQLLSFCWKTNSNKARFFCSRHSLSLTYLLYCDFISPLSLCHLVLLLPSLHLSLSLSVLVCQQF